MSEKEVLHFNMFLITELIGKGTLTFTTLKEPLISIRCF